MITAGGAAVCRSFSFVVNPALPCAGNVNASIHFQDGATDLGTQTYTFQAGAAGPPQTISYVGPPVPIPDAADLSGTNPGAPVVANLPVSGIVGFVGDINLRIDGTSCSNAAGSTTVGIDHTFVNDLKLRLRSPSGTVVEVVVNTDGSGNNFCQTVLDDQSGGPSIQSVVSANAPFTGSFTPANPLSVFNGQNPNGTWQLEAQDYFSGDTGNIRAFSLIITPRTCATSCARFGIRDDTNGNILIFDAAGNYTLLRCAKNLPPITGVGGLSFNGCKVFFTAGAGKGATNTVSAVLNQCTNVADATIVSAGTTFKIHDSNIVGDVLSCP